MNSPKLQFLYYAQKRKTTSSNNCTTKKTNSISSKINCIHFQQFSKIFYIGLKKSMEFFDFFIGKTKGFDLFEVQ
jgi:hypothetical protein